MKYALTLTLGLLLPACSKSEAKEGPLPPEGDTSHSPDSDSGSLSAADRSALKQMNSALKQLRTGLAARDMEVGMKCFGVLMDAEVVPDEAPPELLKARDQVLEMCRVTIPVALSNNDLDKAEASQDKETKEFVCSIGSGRLESFKDKGVQDHPDVKTLLARFGKACPNE